jgi:putative NADH-flavin reductase
MSQEIYSCIDLLNATEAEKKEAMDQLKASLVQKAVADLKAVWQTDIGGISRAVVEDGNVTLCKLVAVEQVEQPAKTEAEKSAEFLAAVAKYDHISWNALHAADPSEPIQYTFQPVLKAAPYHRYNNPW